MSLRNYFFLLIPGSVEIHGIVVTLEQNANPFYFFVFPYTAHARSNSCTEIPR